MGTIKSLQGVNEHAKIAWILGVRSRAIRGLLILGLLLLGFAFLSSAFSLRQPTVVALDVGISGIRLMTMLLALFWVQETFVRDIERRTVVVPFVLPVPRWTYVVGRFLGVILLIATAVTVWGGGLYLASHWANWGNPGLSMPVYGWGFGLVLFGIVVDAIVIAAFTLAVTSVAVTQLLPLLVGAMFAISARALGPVTEYLEFSVKADPALRETILPILKFIRWCIPDLSRVDFREITLYGSWPSWEVAMGGVVLACGYGTVMMAVAVASYSKREFR